MDHSYILDRPVGPLPPEVAVLGAQVVASLHAGRRAVVLAGPPASGKTTIIDAVLDGMPGRVTRITNRLPTPLTLTRLLFQLGAPEPATNQDAGDSLIRTLSMYAYEVDSGMLCVDDAHTLPVETLQALLRVPGLGGPDLPGMSLVMVGEPGLLETLTAPGLERFLDPERTLILKLPGTEPDKPAVELAPWPEGETKAVEAASLLSLADDVAQPADHAGRPADGMTEEERAHRRLVHLAVGGAVGGVVAAMLAVALLFRFYGPVHPIVATPAPRASVTVNAPITELAPALPVAKAPLAVPVPMAAEPAPPVVAMPLATAPASPSVAGTEPAPLLIAPVPLPPTAMPPPAPVALAPAAPAPVAAAPVIAVPADPFDDAPAAQPVPGALALPPTSSAPTPSAAAPAAVAPAEAAPRAAPAAPTEIQLRKDFATFLGRAGHDTAQMTPAARETLFQEYMQWRARSAAESSGR